MASSILPFKTRFPVLAAALLLTALTAWLACGFYSVELSPDVTLFKQEAALKDRWAEKMTREFGAKVLVYGGSSCTFSIDGERLMNRFHLPVVNYGYGAELGPLVLTESVMDHVRPGDTLIMALEPNLLTDPFDPPAAGVKFAFAEHHPRWVLHPAFSGPADDWFHALAALRPGSYHTFTLLGKIAGRRPLMRYSITDFNPSGFAQTKVRVKITGPPGNGPELSADARAMLQHLRTWCDQRQVRLAYSLPWGCTPPEAKAAFQRSNIDFLLQINAFIPVLKDPQLGADTDPDHYADTVWHLSGTGSALRTDALGAEIKNWDLWTEAELRRLRVQ